LGLEVGAGQHVDLEAGLRRLAPLLLDRLALPGIERGEVVVEILVPVIDPMELLAHPLEEPGVEEGLGVGVLGEMDVQRRDPALAGELDEAGESASPWCQAGRRGAPARAARDGGERASAERLRVINGAAALIGVGPAMVEDVFAVGWLFR